MLDLEYEDLYKFSLSNPEEFWDEIAKEVIWHKTYSKVLEDKYSSSPKWFIGGEINMSYNCLDKHVEDGYGDEVAVIHESPITGSTQLLTYKQLLQSVSLLAGIMVDRCGIKKGDIVLIYFPVIPECLISMLACTRIGATYVVVYGGFSVKELAARMLHTEPKMIITCNVGPEPNNYIYYKEKVDDALKINGLSPKYCLVFNRQNFKCAPMNSEIDLDWTTEMFKANTNGPTPVNSNHPIFIIYTSGTAGEPKGIVHQTGGTIVHNKYIMKYIIGCKPKETLWAFSDFGWVLGQSIMSYGALMMRTKTVLYEGKLIGTPDNLQFSRVLNWHKVSMILCPPTVMKILRKFIAKSELEMNYSGLHSIYLGGEVVDQEIIQWITETFNSKVITGWGQTELGGITNTSSHQFKNKNNTMLDNLSLFQTPGLDFRIVEKETGIEQPRGILGRIVLKLPIPPSMASTLYKNNENFIKFYFDKYPGYWDTMDAGIISENGSVKIMSRDDDIIHVAATRICGSAVEDACRKNNDISDVAVIALEDKIQGFVPFAFLMCKEYLKKPNEEIIAKTVELINDIIGEVACFQKAVIVPDIPRTLSKVHRSSLSAMIHGKKYNVPPTVVNSQIYPLIHDILINAGYNSSLPMDI